MSTLSYPPKKKHNSVVDAGETPFLLLACDGVWDVLSDDEACALVLEAWDEEVRAVRAICPLWRGRKMIGQRGPP